MGIVLFAIGAQMGVFAIPLRFSPFHFVWCALASCRGCARGVRTTAAWSMYFFLDGSLACLRLVESFKLSVELQLLTVFIEELEDCCQADLMLVMRVAGSAYCCQLRPQGSQPGQGGSQSISSAFSIPGHVHRLATVSAPM